MCFFSSHFPSDEFIDLTTARGTSDSYNFHHFLFFFSLSGCVSLFVVKTSITLVFGAHVHKIQYLKLKMKITHSRNKWKWTTKCSFGLALYFKIYKFYTIFDLREGQREKQMIFFFFFVSCQTVGNVLVLHEILKTPHYNIHSQSFQ